MSEGEALRMWPHVCVRGFLHTDPGLLYQLSQCSVPSVLRNYDYPQRVYGAMLKGGGHYLSRAAGGEGRHGK